MVDQHQEAIFHISYIITVNITKRQNDITTLLVQQNLSYSLPPRDIPLFNGDPLRYQAFMRVFGNALDRKSTMANACTVCKSTPGGGLET